MSKEPLLIMHERNAGLDIMRFVACTLVICHHFEFLWPEDKGHLLHDITHYLQRFGRVGVPLFFVLSGYLISNLLFAEQDRMGGIALGRFYWRRGFRIYPAFWVMFGATVLIFLVAGLPLPLNNLAAEIAFVQNYFVGIWEHTWTLAVEEHFYFALPLLLLALRRADEAKQTPFSLLPWCFLAVSIACLAGRFVVFSKKPFEVMPYLSYTHLRMDSLFFGVIIAWALRYRGLASLTGHVPSWLLILGGWLLLHPAYLYKDRDIWWVPVIGPTSFHLGSGLILLASLRLKDPTILPLRLCCYLGRCSYGIYLWHIIVGGFGVRAFMKITGVQEPRICIIVYVLGAIVVGWLSTVLVEQPVLRARDRLFPSRSDKIPT